MKITDIRTYAIRVGKRNQLLVKVETDKGLYGWGESGVTGRELAVEGAVRHFREFLIGRDPMRRGALWQEMYRSQYFEGGRILTAAISAIDIALHDIAGKALSVPVYELLGGCHRDHVECFAALGGRSIGELVDTAKELAANGWRAIRPVMTQAAGSSGDVFEPWDVIGVTADELNRFRQAVGGKVFLGIDLHHRLTVAEAASLCQKLAPGTLDFVEEPIRDESPQAYRTLRSMTSIPFAIGEEMASKWQFLPFIEQGLANYARIDICNIGGFTEAMKVAGWAEAHYIDVMPHNPLGPVCTAASIHFSAAVPNFSFLAMPASQ